MLSLNFLYQIQKIIYNTNVLEEFNRQVRKFTKVRTIFSINQLLNKYAYVAKI